jgi:hypothetical protein
VRFHRGFGIAPAVPFAVLIFALWLGEVAGIFGTAPTSTAYETVFSILIKPLFPVSILVGGYAATRRGRPA